MTTILERALEYVRSGHAFTEADIAALVRQDVDAAFTGNDFAKLLAGGAIDHAAAMSRADITHEIHAGEGGNVHNVVMADSYSTQDAV